MSLEQAIAANTEALQQLMKVIQAAGMTGVAVEDTPPSKPVVIKGKKAEAPQVSAAEQGNSLVYDDIKVPMLKLITKNRAKAIEVCENMGLGKNGIKEIQDKPLRFQEALTLINAALAEVEAASE